MEKKWWHKSVVYQIYPRSFKDSNNDGIGDLKGIISKLSYLEKLGIDLIWLSPVYQSPMEDNGYDISNYQAIDPLFGNMDTMDQLIKEANKKGIKIMMDLVLNHTSDKHEWFIQAKSSKDNPYRDYYIWRDEPSDLKSVFGGSAWEYDEETKQYYFHQFAKSQPDLNWENLKVQDEIFKMINWWLEKGIAGFRLDVIDLIGKQIDDKILANGPKLHSLIQKLNKHTFGNYDTVTVGETWGATPEIAEMYSDPKRQELSMIFQFEHMTLDWGKYGKWQPKELNFIELKKTLSKWQTELKNGWNSLFWNNHDLPRIVSRWGNDKQYRVKSAQMFAILLHMMKGTPYIYQGEEIGMTNVRYKSIDEYNDIEIKGSYQDFVVRDQVLTHDEFMEGVYKMGRDNARTPMQWNNSFLAGFTKAKPWLKINTNYRDINVENAIKDQSSVFYTYKKLIDMRKHSVYGDTIVYGDYKLLLEDDPHIFAYKRKDDHHELLVLVNFSDEFVNVKLDEEPQDILISNYIDSDIRANKLRPYESIVYIL